MITTRLHDWGYKQGVRVCAAAHKALSRLEPERRLSERSLVAYTLFDIFHSMKTGLAGIKTILSIIESKKQTGKYASPDEVWADVQVLKEAYSRVSYTVDAIIAFLIEGEKNLPNSFVHHTLSHYNVIFAKHFIDNRISFSLDHSGISEHSDYINMPIRDFHAILTDIFMAAAIAGKGKRGCAIKVDAVKEARNGRTYFKISAEDNCGPRKYPLLPESNDLIRKYGGFAGTETLANGVTRTNIFLPKA